LTSRADQVYLTPEQQLLIETILAETDKVLEQSLAGTLTNIDTLQFLVTFADITVTTTIRYVYPFFKGVVSTNLINFITLKHIEVH
jgi:hypothetical protein